MHRPCSTTRKRGGNAIHILITIILWASAYVGIRIGLHSYGPFEMALFRYLVASASMAALAPVAGIRLPGRRDLGLILLTGAIGISVYNMALNYGERFITAGEACFIINTAPLFTALLACLFLKERLTPRFMLGLCTSFIGVTLIALRFESGLSFRAGTMMVLVAAVAHAAFFVLQRPLLKRYRPLEVTSYTIWSGTLCLLPFITGLPGQFRAADPGATLSVVYLGIFPAAVANFSWSRVLSKMAASQAASFLYAVPVVTLVIGFVLIREIPSPISIAGGILAIGGVAVGNAKLRFPKTHFSKGDIHKC